MKWIKISEVKKEKLVEYLMKIKQENYTLIGLEQTSNSVEIQDFDFPKKSVLVLGNEREGIPIDLISYFDVVCEIPQSGIIRSLNVHVSAALAIWEYSRKN